MRSLLSCINSSTIVMGPQLGTMAVTPTFPRCNTNLLWLYVGVGNRASNSVNKVSAAKACLPVRGAYPRHLQLATTRPPSRQRPQLRAILRFPLRRLCIMFAVSAPDIVAA